MTKTLIAVLVAAAMATGAQSALADVPATLETKDYGAGTVSTCTTGYQAGTAVATGQFVDGCTVKVTCTDTVACRVTNRSVMIAESFIGHRMTVNSRLRFISSTGAVTGQRDKTCSLANWCRADDLTTINPGQSASVQCNGVRQTGANRAKMRCQIHVTRTCRDADVAVNKLTQAAAEAAVLCLSNVHRASAGLAALAFNTPLTNAARGHAQAAVAQKWWTAGRDPHTNPTTRSTPQSRIAASGYCPAPKQWSTGENTFWGWATGTGAAAPTPRAAVTWWMNSPGHRANIMSAAFADIGVGVVLGTAAPVTATAAGTFVQNFGNCIN